MSEAPSTISGLDEPALARLAGLLAALTRQGDTITLEGALGAGKTTFARAFIRSALEMPHLEVPSPTFSLVQTYEGARFNIAHLDLYRLPGTEGLDELGLDELLAVGAVLVEWPDRAKGALTGPRLAITIREGAADRRDVILSAERGWSARLARVREIRDFLAREPGAAGWDAAEVRYLQGDASPRSYLRLERGGVHRIVMSAPAMPDGPPVRDGKPYSRIAHLAENVGPFVAVGLELRRRGLAAPQLHAADLPRGLLLIEDFGDLTFGEALKRGFSREELWRAATEALVGLRAGGPPAPIQYGGAPSSVHVIPPFDRGALAIETELLVDWYWPAAKGASIPPETRSEFLALWAPVFDRILAQPPGLLLRDYHSPNLMWRPEKSGLEKVGVLDFQDAMVGPWAYDLVSLLQDARLDVPADLEALLKAEYQEHIGRSEPGFDRAAFDFTYAALGLQRNTKIAGIFARLWRRDGKPQYLAHLPRIWRYIDRNLAHHELAPLRAWYARHFSVAERSLSA